MMVAAGCILLGLVTTPTLACLNDRDTLAEEAQGLPNVIQIVSGRFERNPPLYYQMRIKRLEADVAMSPQDLNDYDDIAVAYDRLGDDVDAIRWIERKKPLLAPLNVADANLKEAWYRYYANCGTFHFHHWLKNGAAVSTIAEAKTARSMIASALEIKPDAHLGREKYQLRVMDWVINWKAGGSENYDLTATILEIGDREEAIKGLTGLVVLGNAWESVDIFAALAQIMHSDHRDIQVGYLCALRAKELYGQGKRSIVDASTDPADEIRKPMWPQQQKDDESTFAKLRAEADRWQKARTDYMMARLSTGRHPDTDPTFWRDYHDDGPPVLQVSLSRRFWLAIGGQVGAVGLFALAAILMIPLYIGLKSALKARRRF